MKFWFTPSEPGGAGCWREKEMSGGRRDSGRNASDRQRWSEERKKMEAAGDRVPKGSQTLLKPFRLPYRRTNRKEIQDVIWQLGFFFFPSGPLYPSSWVSSNPVLREQATLP